MGNEEIISVSDTAFSSMICEAVVSTTTELLYVLRARVCVELALGAMSACTEMASVRSVRKCTVDRTNDRTNVRCIGPERSCAGIRSSVQSSNVTVI